MFNNIRASELKGLIGKVNIIDIRKNFMYNLGSIPTSKNIPKEYLLTFPDKYLNKNDIYYIYCSAGMESVKVCDTLTNMGYKVVNVLGGYHDYLTG